MRTCAVSLDDRVLGMLMPRGSVASLVKIKVDFFFLWEGVQGPQIQNFWWKMG